MHVGLRWLTLTYPYSLVSVNTVGFKLCGFKDVGFAVLKSEPCGPHKTVKPVKTPSYIALALLQVTVPVTFPETFTPQQVMTPNTPCLKPLTYELRGVVDHLGSLQGGHYTARCRSAVDNNWYQCNDSTVTSINFDGLPSSMPYLLFYKKKD